MTDAALHDAQVLAALAELPGWTHEHNALVRHWTFGGFEEAMSFVTRVALHAQSAQHHPEIINVYNRVTLRLNTHDAGGKVTIKDVELARRIARFDWTN